MNVDASSAHFGSQPVSGRAVNFDPSAGHPRPTMSAKIPLDMDRATVHRPTEILQMIGWSEQPKFERIARMTCDLEMLGQGFQAIAMAKQDPFDLGYGLAGQCFRIEDFPV
jgi:hypothetical protein